MTVPDSNGSCYNGWGMIHYSGWCPSYIQSKEFSCTARVQHDPTPTAGRSRCSQTVANTNAIDSTDMHAGTGVTTVLRNKIKLLKARQINIYFFHIYNST